MPALKQCSLTYKQSPWPKVGYFRSHRKWESKRPRLVSSSPLSALQLVVKPEFLVLLDTRLDVFFFYLKLSALTMTWTRQRQPTSDGSH